jgi:hypothetical protein
MAKPFLDTRNNLIHMEVSRAFGPKAEDAETNRIHEVEGARIAREEHRLRTVSLEQANH